MASRQKSFFPRGWLQGELKKLDAMTGHDDSSYHRWAERVEDELDRYRATTILFDNPEGWPIIMISPLQVTWHQNRRGSGRCVTCVPFEDGVEFARAYFFSEGDWKNRREQIVSITGDVALFAREVWDYLKPSQD
jgi:hypothetical protein